MENIINNLFYFNPILIFYFVWKENSISYFTHLSKDAILYEKKHFTLS